MSLIRQIALGLGTLFLLHTSSLAQTITPLVVEGDMLPNGAVKEIFNVDVNNSGEWVVEVRTDNPSGPMGDAVIMNGTVIHLEGTNLGIPSSHAGWVYDGYIDSMDINDHGDVLMHMHVKDSAGVLPDRELVLWTSGSTGIKHVLLEENVTPVPVMGEPAGAVWQAFGEVWQNNNNQIVVAGKSDTDWDDLHVVMTHDGAGIITSQVAFAMAGVNHSTAFPLSDGLHPTNVERIARYQHNFAMNDSGQKMFIVDDVDLGPGGAPDYTAVDTHYYIDDTELLWEGEAAPTGGSFQYDDLYYGEVDLNNAGDWVGVFGDTNTNASEDYFIVKNGVLFQQEGQAPPGVSGGFVMTGYNWGRVQLSYSGDVFWRCDWDQAPYTQNSALYRNSEILIREGVTVIGGYLVENLDPNPELMAVSDNGVYVLQGLDLTGNIDGAFMIELPIGHPFCFGSGIGANCPCGNMGAGGGGCGNSAGTSGLLDLTGSEHISSDNLTLLGSELPPGAMGVFFTGTSQASGSGTLLGDGRLCIAGPLQRLEVVLADANGDLESSISILSALTVMPGVTSYFQLWYSDPSGPCGIGFNTTNAQAVTWD